MKLHDRSPSSSSARDEVRRHAPRARERAARSVLFGGLGQTPDSVVRIARSIDRRSEVGRPRFRERREGNGAPSIDRVRSIPSIASDRSIAFDRSIASIASIDVDPVEAFDRSITSFDVDRIRSIDRIDRRRSRQTFDRSITSIDVDCIRSIGRVDRVEAFGRSYRSSASIDPVEGVEGLEGDRGTCRRVGRGITRQCARRPSTVHPPRGGKRRVGSVIADRACVRRLTTPS
jgi:hypothetical protein